MARFTDKQQREIFHFLFLERLLKASDPALYVLKGGVNLRFFFKSPRYSEDMDLDVLGGSVETLKKNAYKTLEDPAFQRVLRTFGIESLRINDPLKAKQIGTTQRFKVRLVNEAGEEFPTKVEFSRRAQPDGNPAELRSEVISPEFAAPYQRLAYACQHYLAQAAVEQKIRALAGRSVSQARDPFDLYILHLGGHVRRGSAIELIQSERAAAIENLVSLSYEDYVGQVLEYLLPEDRARFEPKAEWERITDFVLALIDGKGTEGTRP